MTLFHYKAIKQTGEVFEGDIDVPDKTSLFNAINTGGTSLISAEEASTVKSSSLKKITNFFSRIKTDEKINFARNLSAMLSAGLSLARALSVMNKQSKNPFFQKTLSEIEEAIRRGDPLSEALKRQNKIWDNLFVSMIKAGEESGDISKSLAEISNQMEKSHALQKKITGAMVYPAIIIGVMLLIAILMLIYVVPTLTSTFKELNVSLPISTRAIIFVSDFLKEQTVLFILTLGLLGAGIYGAFKSKVTKKYIDYISPKLPLVGNLVKQNNSAKTARTLSSLLLSGVEVVSSINITREVLANEYYRSVLDEAAVAVQKGVQMSEVFEKYEHLYPVFVSEMTAVGEETGKLAEMLSRVASYYENEIEQQTKNLSTIIEPVLMVVIGAGVGFFAVSMILPMYSLVNSI